MLRPEPRVLLLDGWGNLVFVLALGGLAVALYVRRSDEPATSASLVGASGLFGSTLVVVAGLPVLALATGGPMLWLFHLATSGVYLAGWGGMVAMALLLTPSTCGAAGAPAWSWPAPTPVRSRCWGCVWSGWSSRCRPRRTASPSSPWAVRPSSPPPS